MKDKPVTLRRMLNIAQRMIEDGEVFYASISPRMTEREYDALHKFGFRIQSEWPHPPEVRYYYAMRNTDIRGVNSDEKNRKLLFELRKTISDHRL